MVSSPYS